MGFAALNPSYAGQSATSASSAYQPPASEASTGSPVSSVLATVNGTHLEGHNAMGFVPIYPRSRQISREDVLQVINHSRQLMIPPDREMVQALPREFRIDGERGVPSMGVLLAHPPNEEALLPESVKQHVRLPTQPEPGDAQRPGSGGHSKQVRVHE